MRNISGLGPLETLLLDFIWRSGRASAEACREGLRPRELKDSTVRTVLRRLEEKGYVTHEVDGRTFQYKAKLAPHRAAARAVQRIAERFCGGSLEQLLLGMVDNEVVDGAELTRIAARIAQAKEKGTGGKRK